MRPARSPPPAWTLASAGAIVAAITWLVASWGLGIYTSRFASYNETNGTLGAVVVVLIWLFVSGFAVPLGAVVDSAIQSLCRGRYGMKMSSRL
jgi:membrane protein